MPLWREVTLGHQIFWTGLDFALCTLLEVFKVIKFLNLIVYPTDKVVMSKNRPDLFYEMSYLMNPD